MLLLLPLSLKLSCHDHLTVDIMPLHRNKIGQIINEFHVLQIADWEGIIIPKEKNPYLLVVVLILRQINLPKKKEIYSGYRAIMHCTNIQSLTLISEDQLKFILILVLINFLFQNFNLRNKVNKWFSANHRDFFRLFNSILLLNLSVYQ